MNNIREDDNESKHSNDKVPGRSTNRKILDESNAKQLALDAINKLFKNGLGSVNNSVADENNKRNDIIYINSVPDNLKSSNEQTQNQLQYNKGLSRQANHTLQKISNYGMNTFNKPINTTPHNKNDLNQNETVLNIQLKQNNFNNNHHNFNHNKQQFNNPNNQNRNNMGGMMDMQPNPTSVSAGTGNNSNAQNLVKKDDKLSMMKDILKNFNKK